MARPAGSLPWMQPTTRMLRVLRSADAGQRDRAALHGVADDLAAHRCANVVTTAS